MWWVTEEKSGIAAMGKAPFFSRVQHLLPSIHLVELGSSNQIKFFLTLVIGDGATSNNNKGLGRGEILMGFPVMIRPAAGPCKWTIHNDQTNCGRWVPQGDVVFEKCSYGPGGIEVECGGQRNNTRPIAQPPNDNCCYVFTWLPYGLRNVVFYGASLICGGSFYHDAFSRRK